MSNFKLHSLGTATAKLKRGSLWLEIYPHEMLNDHKGDVASYKKKSKVKINTVAEKNKVVKVEKTLTLKAKWKGTGGNQITAPTVHVGELVELWKVKDSDRWFWTKLRNEPDIRGLEDEVTMWSGLDRSKKSNIGKLADMRNSYSHVVSTKKGYVQFTSSKKNGEKVKYTDRMDMKHGFVKLTDDRGNFVELNSIKGTWGVKTNSGIKLVAPSVSITGNLSVSGSSTFNGPATMNSSQTVNGCCTVTGQVKAGSISSCCSY